IFKYFTTLYMTVKNADTYLSYTKEYEDFVDEKSTDIADIAFVQQNYLKDGIHMNRTFYRVWFRYLQMLMSPNL
ncbi:MAG: hypothetical protein J6T47_02080, partial [Lachnospiraceae bacterium]|nr:hypothetical protein [Lachnospiraceae bacterium]